MNYEELKKKVMEFFSDRSRSAEETKADLTALRDEIEMLIESL